MRNTHTKENRKKRHNIILELVKNNKIYTQEQLAEMLKETGYVITQATLSRDIKELNLIKTSKNGSKTYYSADKKNDFESEGKYYAVFREGFISSRIAMNMLVIKTVSGLAMAVAAALDNIKLEELLGCVAGDDTIICVTESTENAKTLSEKLNKLVK